MPARIGVERAEVAPEGGWVSSLPSGTLDVRVAYWDDPEQVIWIDLTFPDGRGRRLLGYDNYWVSGNWYGVWQDEENIGHMYDLEGRHRFAWRWTPGVGEAEAAGGPPPSARVWRGYMLTDEQARFVGLVS